MVLIVRLNIPMGHTFSGSKRGFSQLFRSHQFGGSISFRPFLWTKNLTLGDILCIDLN